MEGKKQTYSQVNRFLVSVWSVTHTHTHCASCITHIAPSHPCCWWLVACCMHTAGRLRKRQKREYHKRNMTVFLQSCCCTCSRGEALCCTRCSHRENECMTSETFPSHCAEGGHLLRCILFHRLFYFSLVFLADYFLSFFKLHCRVAGRGEIKCRELGCSSRFCV